MTGSTRLVAAPVIAFGMAFAVVLPLGQLLSPPASATEEYDLEPLLYRDPSPDDELARLEPQVWDGAGDQRHLCLQVPDGWRIRSSGWTRAAGPIHCLTTTAGEELTLTLEEQP